VTVTVTATVTCTSCPTHTSSFRVSETRCFAAVAVAVADERRKMEGVSFSEIGSDVLSVEDCDWWPCWSVFKGVGNHPRLPEAACSGVGVFV